MSLYLRKSSGRTIVYFVDSAVSGGSEQALIHLLARLDRRRWRPVLFHHPGPGVAPLLQEAHRLKVETRVVPRLQKAGTISGLPHFLRQLRRERPIIFHAQLNWLLSCKYGLAVAALSRVPVVMATLQSFLQPPWEKNIYLQQQLVAAGVDQYIAVSQAVARQLSQSFRVPSGKVTVIYNSIPFAAYGNPVENRALGTTPGDGTERPVVLTVARLDEQKGHKFLLEAVRQVPEATFLLAGSGPERTTLEAQARSLAVAGRVRFLGHRSDIPALLAGCDLFVLPSVYEGLPLSVLEAMAAGKAVVATAVGGTPEAVMDGETGILVPPGDPAALAQAIRNLLSNPALAGRMGTAGKVRVQQAFSIETMAQRTNQLYEELLHRHESG